MAIQNLSNLLCLCLAPGNRANAFKVSLVVGSLLNFVNHGAAIIHGHIAWGNLALNYLIPFCVAAYSGARAMQKKS
jgi:hypothetical protein